jgi:hypothetical protein
MPFLDKDKQRESSRKHYAKNKEAIKERTLITNRLIRQRNREYVIGIKGNTPCADCGVSYPPYVMQFDHIIEGKRANVSDLVRSGVSIDNIQIEIDKCELVCANCHAERTHGTQE